MSPETLEIPDTLGNRRRQGSGLALGIIYLVLAAVVLTREHAAMRGLLKDGLRTPVPELANPSRDSVPAGEPT